jgi:hypothetical protein
MQRSSCITSQLTHPNATAWAFDFKCSKAAPLLNRSSSESFDFAAMPASALWNRTLVCDASSMLRILLSIVLNNF